MNITFAYICLDCDEVYSINEYKACPNCGSKNSAPLAKWLGSISLMKNENLKQVDITMYKQLKGGE